jgi:hypothetical protein
MDSEILSEVKNKEKEEEEPMMGSGEPLIENSKDLRGNSVAEKIKLLNIDTSYTLPNIRINSRA